MPAAEPRGMPMRTYHEPVQVRHDPLQVPQRFCWRGRLLLVREVLGRWSETGAWWDSPLVRAARGDDFGTDPPDPGADLLAEHELWRVLAVTGSGAEGVYELDHACGSDEWRLRSVVD